MLYHLAKTKSECDDQFQAMQETKTLLSEIQFRVSTSFQFPDSLMPVSFERAKMQKCKIAGISLA